MIDLTHSRQADHAGFCVWESFTVRALVYPLPANKTLLLLPAHGGVLAMLHISEPHCSKSCKRAGEPCGCRFKEAQLPSRSDSCGVYIGFFTRSLYGFFSMMDKPCWRQIMSRTFFGARPDRRRFQDFFCDPTRAN
jgi:hypothetical protein